MASQALRALPMVLSDPVSLIVLPLAYFATAVVCLINFGINTPIWFANALVVAGILRLPGVAWPIILSIIYIADSVALTQFGGGPGPLLALADIGEILLVATLIRRLGGAEGVLTGVWGLGGFILICLSVPILSSTWGAGVLAVTSGGTFLPDFTHWYAGTALGYLVVCPSLMIWLTPDLRKEFTYIEARRLLPPALAFAIFSMIVVKLDYAPLLFVTFPALLLLVWRGGLIGASFGSVILLAIGLWETFASHQSMLAQALPATDLPGRIEALQIYLGALTLSSLPLAVVLTDHRRLSAELVRVADARREFLAAMSHEIRTPMTAVLGLVDLLEAEDPTPRQRGRLKSMRASGRHLLNIINDILDFSRLETGRIDLERVDFSLPALLAQITDALEPLARDRGIDLTIRLANRSPPVVRGDPTRIGQILLNLVGNGIKFTPQGSVLVIAAHCPDGAGSRFRFEIQDTGIGMTPEQQARVFSAFTQADHSTSRQYGGSGLGLAISKRLVDAMGGLIGVESTLGSGSLFWFEIPLELGEVANIRRDSTSVAPAVAPRRILLAEDVELNRDIIRTILERDGHQVTTAENGLQALRKVEEEKFDLIFMDVHMPVMDGLEATRAIRHLPGAAARTPIVALTANVMASEQEKCRSAGMERVLMKPIDWEEVRDVIAHCPVSLGTTLPSGDDRETELSAFDDELFTELALILPAEQLATHAATLAREIHKVAGCRPDCDTAALGQLSHRLVSEAGMVGLTRLSSRAAAVEAACRSGEGMAQALDRFRQVSRDVTDYLMPRVNVLRLGTSPEDPASAAVRRGPRAGSG